MMGVAPEHVSDLETLKEEVYCQKKVNTLAIARKALRYGDIRFPEMTALVLAAGLSTFGLAINSKETLIGAMIVSPFGLPIVKVAFAVVDSRGPLQYGSSSFQACCLGFLLNTFICWAIGFIGCWILMFRKCDEINKWPTEEMDCRTTRKNFEFLFYIGLFCGAVIANATVDYYRHLEFVVSGVGAAIAVALLPPLCNTGMFYALYLNEKYKLPFTGYQHMQCGEEKVRHTPEAFREVKQKAINSTILTCVNVLGMFIAAVGWFHFSLQDEWTCEKKRRSTSVLSELLSGRSTAAGLGSGSHAGTIDVSWVR